MTTDLFGNLSKVVDKPNGSILLQGVVNSIDIHIPLIEQMVEHVGGIHSQRSLLFVPEDEVDPLVDVSAHVVALERLSVSSDKLACVALRPSWQLHVV